MAINAARAERVANCILVGDRSVLLGLASVLILEIDADDVW